MDKQERIPIPEENKPDILKIMQALGGGVGVSAILTSVSFLLSILYNIIYFFVLSIFINNVPLSISDYILTFAFWYNAISSFIFIYNLLYK